MGPRASPSDSSRRVISLRLRRDIDEPVCAGGARGSRREDANPSRGTRKFGSPCLPIRVRLGLHVRTLLLVSIISTTDHHSEMQGVIGTSELHGEPRSIASKPGGPPPRLPPFSASSLCPGYCFG
ncbi:hypothetical protein SNOG_00500 [Parastagonospora nodorum SN15]|uniref:Uncharacterized protein n=1 Tax=Phaeosphaeria nodorum (strain SN15 / ATCC MYA-4574 / FGSC 10173) TaxID=321614 RepID=Q0V664_PHANO|nr:hypothetical protein SNOG_00500 [Parastagonospora nodorum SN15]EAT91995.1 hypothetical protein SNOG_00500 [Parastagonospora nodorum SN15]